MRTDLTHPGTVDDARRDALAGRLFEALLVGGELLTVELGRRLGLYEAVRDHGPLTADELARHAGIAGRYAREWLEQQAVAGILDVASGEPDTPGVPGHGANGHRTGTGAASPGVDADAAPPDTSPAPRDTGAARAYVLPAPHADVLLDPEHPASMAGAAPALTGVATTLAAVADAYRSGTGVPYAVFEEVRTAIALFNRPMFTNQLGREWLPALGDRHARLRRPGVRVLDVGCGAGWSSIALARALPEATVHGVDLDGASVEQARRNVTGAGLTGRVTVTLGDGAVLDGADRDSYDLACVFEALHDMADPVGTLSRIRERLVPDGTLLVADERVAGSFTAPGDEMERFLYLFSVLHCLPATVAEDGPEANGTVLREQTVYAWAAAAGFAGVTTLPVEHDLWRFYRMDRMSDG